MAKFTCASRLPRTGGEEWTMGKPSPSTTKISPACVPGGMVSRTSCPLSPFIWIWSPKVAWKNDIDTEVTALSPCLINCSDSSTENSTIRSPRLPPHSPTSPSCSYIWGYTRLNFLTKRKRINILSYLLHPLDNSCWHIYSKPLSPRNPSRFAVRAIFVDPPSQAIAGDTDRSYR